MAMKTCTNSLGMEFITCPAGTFMMGGEDYEENQPEHQVTLTRSFYLSKYLVTQAQWKAAMGTNPSHFKGANRPVDTVSWEEAYEFIIKLNKKEGISRYRLPTEAEWVYASKTRDEAEQCAAKARIEIEEKLGEYACFGDNSDSNTPPANHKKTDDTSVWEWMEDWYASYTASDCTDPCGPAFGSDRVIRRYIWWGPRQGAFPSHRASCVFGLPVVMGFRLAFSLE